MNLDMQSGSVNACISNKILITIRKIMIMVEREEKNVGMKKVFYFLFLTQTFVWASFLKAVKNSFAW